jgi:hypothetical protein
MTPPVFRMISTRLIKIKRGALPLCPSSANTSSPKNKKKKRVRKKLPDPVSCVTKNCGFFLEKDGVLRCHCDIKSKAKMDEAALKVHLRMKKHLQ